ncbi:Dos2-interacting transcription regulator of RNA-Pol-II-domain-containing protein [Absidia repens]|uniref:MMS19 nucleotide excision repair protein n=1 Tax=Absidia repens TaxID=90262 RepID=A0A1X2I1T3_9FUNG|nr:Dos2-interacting transcription regulator of RNA-Pol-II-domain-containing protein [Absidia repens]
MSVEKNVTDYMVATGSSSVEALNAADNVVKAVNQGAIQENLLQMIQAMGEYLTSEDDFVRSKDQTSFNDTAVSVLVNFYCDRLTETTCVPTILEGLVALTGFSHFSDANAVLVAKRIIECVDLQRYPQAARHSAYQVFQNLVDNYTHALKSINNEFVFGYCKLMDGEKDPRNLMSAFKITRSIIDQFDITAHVEDLFEITFCYFPITFKPPPDDPYGITADDLKISLRMCLAATPLFAKFAVPLILEKLTSTSGSAKKDSMETLALCAPVYGSAVLLPNVEELLDSLKIEIFHASDQTLEDAAVESLRSLVGAISSGVISTTDDPLVKSLKPLLDECLANLNDSESKNAKQTGRILRAAASASDHACHIITETTLPLLLHSYRETEIATRKKMVLEVFLELLESSRVLYGTTGDGDRMDHDIASPLLPYKDRFFGMFESSLLASNEYNGLRLCGLHGLKLMVLHSNYLTENEVGVAIQSFNKILLEELDDELRSAALNSLEAIAIINPSPIADQTIPALVNRLPQNSLEKQTIGYPQLLYALKTLCPERSIFKVALPLLLEKLDNVVENDSEAHYAQAIVSTLLDIVYFKATQNHNDVVPCFESIIWPFITKVVATSLDIRKSQVLLLPDILETISMLSLTVYQKLDSSRQKFNIDKLFKLFVEGDTTTIGISAAEFTPLKSDANDPQHTTVQLFSAVLSSIRKDVALPVESIEIFLGELITLALGSANTIFLNSLVRMIGSIINKLKPTDSLLTFIQSITSKLENIVNQQSIEKQNALLVYVWITKALIMKTHTLGYQLTDKLIGWCSVPIGDLHTPQGFDSLLGDDHLALNKSCFATMTILYKQRFFSFCLPKLVHGFRTSGEDIKNNYLIALSYLLKNVPKQILLNELPPVRDAIAT